jgi:hypothetical protein
MEETNYAIQPVLHPGTEKRHESFNEIARKGEVQLVFLGDSITHGWENKGKTVRLSSFLRSRDLAWLNNFMSFTNSLISASAPSGLPWCGASPLSSGTSTFQTFAPVFHETAKPLARLPLHRSPARTDGNGPFSTGPVDGGNA